MKKKKIRNLILFVVFILVTTVLMSLWKSGFLNQKFNEKTGNEYHLIDTTNEIVVTLPNEPIKTVETDAVESNIELTFTKYKSLTANNDQILLTIISIHCDTCNSDFKTDIVSLALQKVTESIGIECVNGVVHTAGKLKGFLYKSQLKGVPVKYFACIFNDKAYLYVETISGSDESISSKYFESLELNASH